MNKIDINQYSYGKKNKNKNQKKHGPVTNILKNFFQTIFAIGFVSTAITVSSLLVVIIATSDINGNISLESVRPHMQSQVYYYNDEKEQFEEYSKVKSTVLKIWVDYSDIPENMKNAMIAIEDHRFRRHHGVDFYRTGGAIYTMFLGGQQIFGGSTLTQQVIKNITGKKDTTINRKVGEIFNALLLERKYSKDQILEAYLNVVNFGGSCEGVGAAAKYYFNKSISECDLAECACIAAIPQNPSNLNPHINPENNKNRQKNVLDRMLAEEFISQKEYEEALKKREHMVFSKSYMNERKNENKDVYNWYTESVIQDVAEDLAKKENMSIESAKEEIKTKGYKIYSAVDKKAQSIAENVISGGSQITKDPKQEVAFVMMDYKGRILATVGRKGKKTIDFGLDYTVSNKLQPGSSIKPIAVYAPALEEKLLNYSSIVQDKPLTINGKTWPKNVYNRYNGDMQLYDAIAISSNATAAQVLDKLGLDKSYDFLVKKLGFPDEDKEKNKTYSALATGSTGKSVRGMVSAYQIFGNDGKYTAPYTYYWVENEKGEIILDNRNQEETYAISPGNATIMRRLLRAPIESPSATISRAAKIGDWDLFGKTGTTDDFNDMWFIGGSPYAVAGVWDGYKDRTGGTYAQTGDPVPIWRAIMSEYIKDKEKIKFKDDPNVKELKYNPKTGKLSSWGSVGYYLEDNLPG